MFTDWTNSYENIGALPFRITKSNGKSAFQSTKIYCLLQLWLFFSKSLGLLSGYEENTGLSAAIAQMSTVQEKVAYIHNDQVRMKAFRKNVQRSLLIGHTFQHHNTTKDTTHLTTSRRQLSFSSCLSWSRTMLDWSGRWRTWWQNEWRLGKHGRVQIQHSPRSAKPWPEQSCRYAFFHRLWWRHYWEW